MGTRSPAFTPYLLDDNCPLQLPYTIQKRKTLFSLMCFIMASFSTAFDGIWGYFVDFCVKNYCTLSSIKQVFFSCHVCLTLAIFGFIHEMSYSSNQNSILLRNIFFLFFSHFCCCWFFFGMCMSYLLKECTLVTLETKRKEPSFPFTHFFKLAYFTESPGMGSEFHCSVNEMVTFHLLLLWNVIVSSH